MQQTKKYCWNAIVGVAKQILKTIESTKGIYKIKEFYKTFCTAQTASMEWCSGDTKNWKHM